MRTAIVILLCGLSLTGCQSFYSGFGARLETDSYMLVSSSRGYRCYTRIIKGSPHDQVCERNKFVRYSPNPELHTKLEPMPNYVAALFETNGGDDLLLTSYSPETRRSFPFKR